MSSLFKPVGPEDPKTYWRRRALVIAGLVALLIAVVLLLVALLGGGDGQAAAASEPEPQIGLSMSPIPDDAVLAGAPDAASSAAPSTSGSASATGPAAAPSGATTSASAHPAASTAPCADSAIRVVGATASATTPVGAGMVVTMTLTNTGSAACSRDVGSPSTGVRITSGPALIWSSAHCASAPQADVVDLAPGESRSVSLTWPGRTSRPGCPTDVRIGGAGTYRAIAVSGAVESEPVRFLVG